MQLLRIELGLSLGGVIVLALLWITWMAGMIAIGMGIERKIRHKWR